MLALYRCGRQADALEVYRVGRRRLDEELGIEPTPDLRALEQQILNHDPELAAPPERRRLTVRRLGRPRGVLVLGFVLLGAAAAAVWLAVFRSSSASSSIATADTAVLVSPDGKLGTAIPVGASPAHAVSGGGYLWTSNEQDGTVSRIDPETRTDRETSVGRSQEGLAFVDGHVWVANGNANVSEIDPGTGQVLRTIRVGNGPLGLGGRGHELWVANSIDGTLARVDTRTARVTWVAIGPRPVAVAAGKDAVWVTLAGSGAVAKLDR